MSTYSVTARAKLRPVAVAGRTWGSLNVTVDLLSEADVLDLWSKRDQLIVAAWPLGWRAPDGSTPNPDPVATLAAEATAAGQEAIANRPAHPAAPPAPLAVVKSSTGGCCAAGRHPRVDELNQDLLSGVPVRKVADKFNVGKSTVGKHWAECLDKGANMPSAVSADMPDNAPDSAPVTPDAPAAGSQRANAAHAPTNVSAPTVKTHGTVRALPISSSGQDRATQQLRHAQAALDEEQRVEAERVKVVADVISAGLWADRPTVLGLAQRWGVPEEDVQRIHALAAAKVKANRGSRSAVLETSLAMTKQSLVYETQEALRAWAEAEKAEKGDPARGIMPDPQATKWARKRAAMHRTQQLAFQKHYDTLLGLTSGKITLNVSYTTHPDFTAAWKVISQLLELVAPGAAPKVLEGLAVWEDDGDEGLAAWTAEFLANQRALVVEAEEVTDG